MGGGFQDAAPEGDVYSSTLGPAFLPPTDLEIAQQNRQNVITDNGLLAGNKEWPLWNPPLIDKDEAGGIDTNTVATSWQTHDGQFVWKGSKVLGTVYHEATIVPVSCSPTHSIWTSSQA
ncbi:hypothetical protein ACQY0O_006090 [Thecaphora frezii]